MSKKQTKEPVKQIIIYFTSQGYNIEFINNPTRLEILGALELFKTKYLVDK